MHTKEWLKFDKGGGSVWTDDGCGLAAVFLHPFELAGVLVPEEGRVSMSAVPNQRVFWLDYNEVDFNYSGFCFAGLFVHRRCPAAASWRWVAPLLGSRSPS